MMRIVVFAIIGGIAAFMAWVMMNPDCEGTIAASEQQCVSLPGFDRAFCATAFSRPEEAIYRAGNVFRTQQDCQVRFLNCIEFPGVHGWTPKPQGYCLVRGTDGALAKMTPIYDRPR